jgi:uncharacterized lipoprotein YbaY
LTMKRLTVLMASAMLAGVIQTRAADFLRPVDPSRQADINGKNASLGDLNLDSVSQPTRSTPMSPISGKAYNVKDVTLTERSLKTVRFNTVPLADAPSRNFAAKRAQADTNVRREREVTKSEAKVRDRQIRAFTPGGEQELKEQLNLRY